MRLGWWGRRKAIIVATIYEKLGRIEGKQDAILRELKAQRDDHEGLAKRVEKNEKVTERHENHIVWAKWLGGAVTGLFSWLHITKGNH